MPPAKNRVRKMLLRLIAVRETVVKNEI